eukprot:15627172-Heterocapsa_arctica.AAC.1
MGGVADPGPPPQQSPMTWNGPPTNWNVGQYTPATRNNDSCVATWKQGKIGDINPWDLRVAQAGNA